MLLGPRVGLYIDLGFGGSESRLADFWLAIVSQIFLIFSFSVFQMLELAVLKLLPDLGWIIAMVLFWNGAVKLYSVAVLYKRYKLRFDKGRGNDV